MLASFALADRTVGELAEPYAMTFAGASKHVKVLESAGLIRRRRAGRSQICSLQPERLAEADRWLRQWEQLWTARLDRLETLIQSANTREKSNG